MFETLEEGSRRCRLPRSAKKLDFREESGEFDGSDIGGTRFECVSTLKEGLIVCSSDGFSNQRAFVDKGLAIQGIQLLQQLGIADALQSLQLLENLRIERGGRIIGHNQKKPLCSYVLWERNPSV